MGLDMDSTFQLLTVALDGAVSRQNTIAHNISNVNTPGYQSFAVDLEEQMKNYSAQNPQAVTLKTTSSRHIGSPDQNQVGSAHRSLNPGLTPDGNNVDLDQEMALMVKNDLYFNSSLNQLNKKISMKKYVLGDGRG